MTFFFNNSDSASLKQREKTLMQRMITLRLAVVEKKILAEELRQIAALSTSEIENKSTELSQNRLDLAIHVNETFKKLHETLINPSFLTITDETPLLEGLKQFDNAHGDYLPLAPLSVDNPDTLALHLNDFAIVYEVFTQYLSCTKTVGELEDNYAISINLSATKLAWIAWSASRPSRITYSQDNCPGLLEKFLAGKLKKDEWLTDLDINRAFKILKLSEKGAHVVPFKPNDMGLSLHFEREKHQLDDPQSPYTIPLVVNLGEDGHSRIDSRGNHWTRLLVTVDPTNSPPIIKATYTDELALPESCKRKISETIAAALKYREQQGDITDSKLKIYSAFPECETPEITIIGSGEQRDGFTCGYRALRGVIADLNQAGTVKLDDNPLYREFMACRDSASFRDFGYRLLIREQPLAAQEREAVTQGSKWSADSFEKKDMQSFIKPSLVEGKLLEFAQTSTTRKIKNQSKIRTADELEALVAENKTLSALKESPIVQNLRNSTEETLTLNLQEWLNNEAFQTHRNNPLAIQAIFAAISENKNLKTIALSGIDKLEPTGEEAIFQQLDPLSLRVEITTSETSSNLSKYLSIIKARNQLLTQLGEKPGKEMPDPWARLFELMLFVPPDTPTGEVFKFFNVDENSRTILNYMSKIGVTGFAKLLEYLAENKDLFIEVPFPYETLSLADLRSIGQDKESNFEALEVLKTHLQSSTPFVPFKHLILRIKDPQEIDQTKLATHQENLLRDLKVSTNRPIQGIEPKLGLFRRRQQCAAHHDFPPCLPGLIETPVVRTDSR